MKPPAIAAARHDDPITIVCIYCGKPQQVGRRAMSLPCRHCHKSLTVENLVVTGYEAKRAIETCGSVTIEPKGNVIANRVACNSLVVRGKLKGNVTCRGTVLIEVSGEIRGDVEAACLLIAPGARLTGKCRITGGQ